MAWKHILFSILICVQFAQASEKNFSELVFDENGEFSEKATSSFYAYQPVEKMVFDVPSELLKPKENPSQKKLSFSAFVESGIEASELRKEQGKESYWTWWGFSTQYALQNKSKISISQDFEYNVRPTDRSSTDNRFIPYLPTVGYKIKTSGFWGSQELSPSVSYAIPVSYNRMSNESRMAGILSGSVHPTWVLNSKVNFSYYFSSRANLASRENIWHDDNKDPHHVSTSVRLLQGPQMEYSLNSTNSMSFSINTDQKFDYNNNLSFAKDVVIENDQVKGYQNKLLGNQVYFTLSFSSELKHKESSYTISPNICKSGNLREDYQFKEDSSGGVETRWLEQDNLSYGLSLSASF